MTQIIVFVLREAADLLAVFVHMNGRGRGNSTGQLSVFTEIDLQPSGGSGRIISGGVIEIARELHMIEMHIGHGSPLGANDFIVDAGPALGLLIDGIEGGAVIVLDAHLYAHQRIVIVDHLHEYAVRRVQFRAVVHKDRAVAALEQERRVAGVELCTIRQDEIAAVGMRHDAETIRIHDGRPARSGKRTHERVGRAVHAAVRGVHGKRSVFGNHAAGAVGVEIFGDIVGILRRLIFREVRGGIHRRTAGRDRRKCADIEGHTVEILLGGSVGADEIRSVAAAPIINERIIILIRSGQRQRGINDHHLHVFARVRGKNAPLLRTGVYVRDSK